MSTQSSGTTAGALRLLWRWLMMMVMLMLAGFVASAQAASSLTAGDAVILSMKQGTATFQWAPLVDIDANATINFTDRSWINTGPGFIATLTAEGYFTFTPSSTVAKGTVFTVTITAGNGGNGTVSMTRDSDGANFSSQIAGVTGWTGTAVFPTGGDTLFIYQGSDASPTFIFGINITSVSTNRAATNWSINNTAATTSLLPSGLVSGTTAIGIALAANNTDWRYAYSGTATAASASTWLSRIVGTGADPTSWTGNTGSDPAASFGTALTVSSASYTVTYNGNSNSGGAAPTDGSSPYSNGATVTVLGNTGNLTRSGFTFAGWNTAADGSGTDYAATGAATFTMGAANVTLYAKWSVVIVAPGAPTIGTATAGNSQAFVSFTAPASNGGATITGYTVTSNPGNISATGANSPIAVTGLSNGTAYTFTVAATNSVGTGSSSSASNSVTPKAAQTITFNNPGAQNFGTTPTLIASSTSSLDVDLTSSTTGVCTITSAGQLTFVSEGTCTINADQAGNTAYSAASQVTQSFSVNAVVPAAPVIGTAAAGSAEATVSFTAPVSNGGAAITGYTVTSNPGGLTGTGSGSPITVTGLTDGVPYTFTVTATNSAGTGSASSASNSVTPKATNTITFANPGAQNFGTTPTLSASATSSDNVTFSSATTAVCAITTGGALSFTTAGTCTIAADEDGNASYLAASQVSRSFTVNAVAPAAPVIGTATGGNAQAVITFTAPASNGGATITGYTVTSSPGNISTSGSGSPITVTGLTNNQSYTFTVTATNSVGTSSPSAASNAVIPSAGWTVTYLGNSNTGGTVPVDAGGPYANGATVTVLGNTGSLVRSGFTFAGWNTAADGSGTNHAATGAATLTMAMANITLYAKWTAIPAAPQNPFNPGGNQTQSNLSPTSGLVPTAAPADIVTNLAQLGNLVGVSDNGVVVILGNALQQAVKFRENPPDKVLISMPSQKPVNVEIGGNTLMINTNPETPASSTPTILGTTTLTLMNGTQAKGLQLVQGESTIGNSVPHAVIGGLELSKDSTLRNVVVQGGAGGGTAGFRKTLDGAGSVSAESGELVIVVRLKSSATTQLAQAVTLPGHDTSTASTVTGTLTLALKAGEVARFNTLGELDGVFLGSLSGSAGKTGDSMPLARPANVAAYPATTFVFDGGNTVGRLGSCFGDYMNKQIAGTQFIQLDSGLMKITSGNARFYARIIDGLRVVPDAPNAALVNANGDVLLTYGGISSTWQPVLEDSAAFAEYFAGRGLQTSILEDGVIKEASGPANKFYVARPAYRLVSGAIAANGVSLADPGGTALVYTNTQSQQQWLTRVFYKEAEVRVAAAALGWTLSRTGDQLTVRSPAGEILQVVPDLEVEALLTINDATGTFKQEAQRLYFYYGNEALRQGFTIK